MIKESLLLPSLGSLLAPCYLLSWPALDTVSSCVCESHLQCVLPALCFIWSGPEQKLSEDLCLPCLCCSCHDKNKFAHFSFAWLLSEQKLLYF